jgi:uracil-DNA glycosylase
MTLTLNLEALADSGRIDPSWVEPLSPVQSVLDDIATKLNQELEQGSTFFPSHENIMRAFQIPFEQVRVLIVGQDPYPTPGDAVGLSFSVSPNQSVLPRSLKNIFTELCADIGCQQPASGDLSPWGAQGVMLLNRVLTVRSGEAGSHRKWGWEQVTEQAIRVLDERATPLAAVLWGNDAATSKEFLPHSMVLESAHPSPLSASRGFFGSQPFSTVNQELMNMGQKPIIWELPTAAALF